MTGPVEAAEVLSIGMIIGGRTPANRAWVDAIQGLMQEVKVVRAGAVSDLKLNVEFQVPGNHLQPDFEGVRTGSFRKADSLLKVQVAVPAQAPDDPRPDLIGFLDAAVEAADQWVAAKRRTFDTTSLHRLVASLGH